LRFTAAWVNQPQRLCNIADRVRAAKKLAIKGYFMVLGIFGRKKRDNQRIVIGVYEALTEAGRLPLLYEKLGVPDTVMGRFEMLAAHMILFLRRARSGSPALQALAQDIVDEFFLDIDHSIRELGVGDVGVPKKMKKFGRMFYGRLDSYVSALDAGDCEARAAALRRNVHPAAEDAPDMGPLALYIAEVAEALDGCTDEEIVAGRLTLSKASADGLAGEPA
jgi:cytochrome b pre-mRNA-processing protein 3